MGKGKGSVDYYSFPERRAGNHSIDHSTNSTVNRIVVDHCVAEFVTNVLVSVGVDTSYCMCGGGAWYVGDGGRS